MYSYYSWRLTQKWAALENMGTKSSTDPQKMYANKMLAWEVGILCYFFQKTGVFLINHSGEDNWGAGACNSNNISDKGSQNLGIHSLLLQQMPLLNLEFNSLKHISPIKSKFHIPIQSYKANPANMKLHGLVSYFNSGLTGHPGTSSMLKHQ